MLEIKVAMLEGPRDPSGKYPPKPSRVRRIVDEFIVCRKQLPYNLPSFRNGPDVVLCVSSPKTVISR